MTNDLCTCEKTGYREFIYGGFPGPICCNCGKYTEIYPDPSESVGWDNPEEEKMTKYKLRKPKQISWDEAAVAILVEDWDIVTQAEVDTEGIPKNWLEELYPCADCGLLRTKAEGGTTFTVCDECWDKAHPKEEIPDESAVAEALGFAHGFCCTLLDKGVDPRTDETPNVLNAWNKRNDPKEGIKDEPMSAEEAWEVYLTERNFKADKRPFMDGFEQGAAEERKKHRPTQTFDEWWSSDGSCLSDDVDFRQARMIWQAHAKATNTEE